MATTAQEDSLSNGTKWGFKPSFLGGKDDQKSNNNNFTTPTQGKYRFWKRGSTKTPGAIKQVRGAQYPPIMDKTQMNKFSKKRNSTSNMNGFGSDNTSGGSGGLSSDSYLNYKSNFDHNSSSILINNHHIANINKRHLTNNNNNNGNGNENENRNGNRNRKNIKDDTNINNSNPLPYPQYPQSRIIEKDNNRLNQNKMKEKEKEKHNIKHIRHNSEQIYGNNDSIPNIDIDELIRSAKNDLTKNGNIDNNNNEKNEITNDNNINNINNINNNRHENINNSINGNIDDNENEKNREKYENNNNNNENIKRENESKINGNNNDINNNNNDNNSKISKITKIESKSKAKSKPKLKEWDEIKSESEAQVRKNHNRINLLTKMTEKSMLDSNALRKACWRGVPREMRPIIWKLLLGYTPKNKTRRSSTLARKRDEYYNLVERYYNHTQKEHRSDQENQIVHQISLDVPRTSPDLKLFQIPNISKLLSRALYIWSHRHTATGYVQGINDLITPFVYIFLNELLISSYNIDLDTNNSREYILSLSEKELLLIEADSYWCLDYLIEGLQLNYTDGQPGIQTMIEQLEEVISRVNLPLSEHFKKEKLEYIQFSFRWMNCLLMRELPLHHIIRLWDTYLCEGVELSAGFSEFHVFVCAALLLCFADELMKKDFAEIMLFIQALPEKTKKWKEREIETILSEAYVYQQLYGKTKKALYN